MRLLPCVTNTVAMLRDKIRLNRLNLKGSTAKHNKKHQSKCRQTDQSFIILINFKDISVLDTKDSTEKFKKIFFVLYP